MIVDALSRKLLSKIAAREPFSFVLLLAGKTGNSHMPMLKTLFAEEPYSGLYTKVKHWCREKGVPMSEYMMVATPMKVVTRDFLLQHGVPSNVSNLTYHSTELPQAGQVSAYTVFDHSKFFIVDAKVAYIGSANNNDRSMLGTHDSDAEMDVEVVGPSAKDLLEKAMFRYTGMRGISTYGQSSGLARRLNEVAMHNNRQMNVFFGIDFAAGRWTAGEYAGRMLFADKSAEKAFRDEFVAWIAGDHVLMRTVSNSAALDWHGIILPLTDKVWGDAYDKYWVDFKNSGIIRDAVN